MVFTALLYWVQGNIGEIETGFLAAIALSMAKMVDRNPVSACDRAFYGEDGG